jgi:hypothetical protein
MQDRDHHKRLFANLIEETSAPSFGQMTGQHKRFLLRFLG